VKFHFQPASFLQSEERIILYYVEVRVRKLPLNKRAACYALVHDAATWSQSELTVAFDDLGLPCP
jgi:hypothetical protein